MLESGVARLFKASAQLQAVRIFVGRGKLHL